MQAGPSRVVLVGKGAPARFVTHQLHTIKLTVNELVRSSSTSRPDADRYEGNDT